PQALVARAREDSAPGPAGARCRRPRRRAGRGRIARALPGARALPHQRAHRARGARARIIRAAPRDRGRPRGRAPDAPGALAAEPALAAVLLLRAPTAAP